MDTETRLVLLDSTVEYLEWLKENFERELKELPKEEQTQDWLMTHWIGMQDALLGLFNGVLPGHIPWPLEAGRRAIHDFVRHGGSKLLNRRTGDRQQSISTIPKHAKQYRPSLRPLSHS